METIGADWVGRESSNTEFGAYYSLLTWEQAAWFGEALTWRRACSKFSGVVFPTVLPAFIKFCATVRQFNGNSGCGGLFEWQCAKVASRLGPSQLDRRMSEVAREMLERPSPKAVVC